ncbi:MAG TPA: sulfotransferase, partial [Longimicrobiales bacterium]
MSAGTVTQPLATDPLGAMGNAKKLFIVGCPRSGTTWMQLLLAQHPSIATAPETQIFAYYLEPMRKQWAQERAGAGRNGSAGLSRLLSDAEFEELCRTSAEFVLEKIRQRNPAAAVVAEKSPKHALQADFIQRLFPDAYFLHVV